MKKTSSVNSTGARERRRKTEEVDRPEPVNLKRLQEKSLNLVSIRPLIAFLGAGHWILPSGADWMRLPGGIS
jgi:hypothetical protein